MYHVIQYITRELETVSGTFTPQTVGYTVLASFQKLEHAAWYSTKCEGSATVDDNQIKRLNNNGDLLLCYSLN